jgi:DNA ligase 1
MLAHPLNKKWLAKWFAEDERIVVQPKLNGLRCRAIIKPTEIQLLSSQANPFDIVHISDQLRTLANIVPMETLNQITLDGELYKHGMPFQEISSRVRRQLTRHEDQSSLTYTIFDRIDPLHDQMKRIDFVAYLRNIILDNSLHALHILPTFIVHNEAELATYYQMFLDDNYEGIILRRATGMYEEKKSQFLMKLKPRKQVEANVIGTVEERDKYGHPKGTLGAFMCELDNGVRFHVGSGLNANQRSKWWGQTTDLPNRILVFYQELSTDGVPIFPIFKEVVS